MMDDLTGGLEELGEVEEGPGDDMVVSDTPPSYGPLIDTEDEAEVAQMVEDDWQRDHARAVRLACYFERNEAWRAGHRGVQVLDDPANPDLAKVWYPPQTTLSAPVPNRGDDSIWQVIAQLTSDPPAPDVTARSDTAEDRDDAEHSQRWLAAESGEAGLNLTQAMERELDHAGTYGSGYSWVYVHPKGGGHCEVEMLAHPLARTVDEAETGPVDEMTGQSQPMPPVTRYVMPDGSLSDSPVGAERRWVPKLCVKGLTPYQVRAYPVTIEKLADASSVVLYVQLTVSEVRELFAERAESFTVADWSKLTEWTLAEVDAKVLPRGVVRKDGRTDDEGMPPDEALVACLVEYRAVSPVYPWGAYVVVAGGDTVLTKQPWMATVGDRRGRSWQEALMLPVAQLRWRADRAGKNYHGQAPIEKLGPLDELTGSAYGAFLEYLFRVNNPNVFLPPGTTVQPEQLNRRDGTPIPLSAEGAPFYEQFPPFPRENGEILDRLSRAQDETIGLRDAARGAAESSVRSGEHQRVAIEQALVSLAPVRNGASDWYERLCRIVLQLAAAYYTEPQRVRVVGDDGAYKARDFTGADFGSARDVKVARGTFQLIPPSARDQIVTAEQQQGTITPEEAQTLRRSGLSRLVGLQDQPDLLRVSRQADLWKQGPQIEAPAVAEDADPVAAQAAERAHQQQLQQASMACFTARPVDLEPVAARIRWHVLREIVCSTWVDKFPPAWSHGLFAAYDQARQAAGVVTLAEQQQAAAPQAAAASNAQPRGDAQQAA